MGAGHTKISIDSENDILNNAKYFVSQSVSKEHPIGRLYGDFKQVENVDNFVTQMTDRLSHFKKEYQNGETRTIEFIHPDDKDQRILLVAIKSGHSVVYVIIRTIDKVNLKKAILYMNDLEPSEEACNAPKWRSFKGFEELAKRVTEFPVICKMVDRKWIEASIKTLLQRHYNFEWYNLPEKLQNEIHTLYQKSS